MDKQSNDIEQFKRDELLDLIRRCIANPHNAKKVADAVARDWNPAIGILKNGHKYIKFEAAP